MKKRSKKPTVTKLKKKAWILFSRYIRLKYADYRGYVRCYTCGKRMHWKDSQAGHGFAGRGKNILFEENVVRPQCVGCNCFQGGKLDIFTYKLRKEHGDKKFEKLYKKAHKTDQWKTWELEKIIKKYRRAP